MVPTRFRVVEEGNLVCPHTQGGQRGGQTQKEKRRKGMGGATNLWRSKTKKEVRGHRTLANGSKQTAEVCRKKETWGRGRFKPKREGNEERSSDGP